MTDLFSNEEVVLCNGDVVYLADFYSEVKAAGLYQKFNHQLAWRQESIVLYGKKVLSPRLQAWYGDKQAEYTYSGLTMTPLPWHIELLNIKNDIQQYSGGSFNSVLANYYRDGNDSMGWHSDDETELGVQPLIASLTLGQTRKFVLKHKTSGEKLQLNLQSGSLLLMSGQLQSNWQHCLPKTKKIVAGRINLTYRQINADETNANNANATNT
ncbi:alpha-ketoglutarate-dependent dioxygenase AlkB family protein [Thalassotalea crassostreae]|uniref:alpha-ketoglutarate-dependent dioxygenase AlkB family protein n=1 Tax=Thalassotalea crassostreae TaxID=1763536 RepID=UPI000839A44B|nr:alpha-ketoglutarate-dependent dioxygenase AlkB [Thalassotalea crassostreae]